MFVENTPFMKGMENFFRHLSCVPREENSFLVPLRILNTLTNLFGNLY